MKRADLIELFQDNVLSKKEGIIREYNEKRGLGDNPLEIMVRFFIFIFVHNQKKKKKRV